MKKKLLLPFLIGNALEYYDFTLFAVFASSISQIIFPPQNEFLNLMLSLAVFAVGFVMRPLGAVIFGHIGDKHGRKKALTLSISCMAIPTFLMGILPGYETLGFLAPILLLVLRLIQGISIGGEGAGGAIFILEHHLDSKIDPQKNPRSILGFLASLITASNFLGAFFAMSAGILLNQIMADHHVWRFAYIIGGLLGFVGFYLRVNALETPIFEKIIQKHQIEKLPLKQAILTNPKAILLSISLGGLAGAFSYTALAYLPIFFKQLPAIENTTVNYAVLGLGSFILFLPFSGKWCDRIGYLRSTLQGCMMVILLIIPLFMMMSIGNSSLIIVSVILFGLLCAWVTAGAYPIMFSLFPPAQRYSGIAFSFNIGLAFFGGTAPMISTALNKYIGLNYAPSFYLVFIALLFCGCYAITQYGKNKHEFFKEPLKNSLPQY